MLSIIVINIIVICLVFLISGILDDKYAKVLNDFCKLECR